MHLLDDPLGRGDQGPLLLEDQLGGEDQGPLLLEDLGDQGPLRRVAGIIATRDLFIPPDRAPLGGRRNAVVRGSYRGITTRLLEKGGFRGLDCGIETLDQVAFGDW